jgi:hypothetical protein
MKDDLQKIVTAEDASSAEKQEMLHELRMTIEREMLSKVLATAEGRRVLFNVIARGDIYDLQGSMPYDLAQSQRCIGRREVALETLKDCLTAFPDVYILMQSEAAEFEKQFAIDLTGDEEDV